MRIQEISVKGILCEIWWGASFYIHQGIQTPDTAIFCYGRYVDVCISRLIICDVRFFRNGIFSVIMLNIKLSHGIMIWMIPRPLLGYKIKISH